MKKNRGGWVDGSATDYKNPRDISTKYSYIKIFSGNGKKCFKILSVSSYPTVFFTSSLRYIWHKLHISKVYNLITVDMVYTCEIATTKITQPSPSKVPSRLYILPSRLLPQLEKFKHRLSTMITLNNYQFDVTGVL